MLRLLHCAYDYYNEFFELGQQKINFKFFELSLPNDDPVYTLKKVMEELDFTNLLAQYSNKGRNGFNPIMKYAVLTYANMRGVRSVDRMVEFCGNIIDKAFGLFYYNYTRRYFFLWG